MQPPALMRKCGIFRQAGKKRGHRLFPKYFLPMPGRDFPGGILLSCAVCLKMEAKTGGKTMKGTGFAAQSLQELVARIRRQIAGDKKSGYLAENPLKRIWLKGTGRVQKDLPAKVRGKRAGIRSGPAALTGIRGCQKGRASPPACAAFWRRRAWCPGHGPDACAEGADW